MFNRIPDFTCTSGYDVINLEHFENKSIRQILSKADEDENIISFIDTSSWLNKEKKTLRVFCADKNQLKQTWGSGKILWGHLVPYMFNPKVKKEIENRKKEKLRMLQILNLPSDTTE